MNKIIILSTFVLLTIRTYSQNNFDYGLSKFDFKNYEKENPVFENIDSILGIDKERINQSLKTLTGCFFSNITFERGQIIKAGSKFLYPNFKRFYNIKLDDPDNFLYNLPSYELIYKFHNSEIEQFYYFNIYLNSEGEIIGQTKFFHSDKEECKLIDFEKAESIVKNKWKNDKSDIYVRFGYYGKKNCFAWIISRSIKGEHDGYLGEMQTFIVDAINGKIIYKKEEKLLYE
jgi:hypothetical protein